MSDLVAIAYPDEAAVTRATANLAEAIREGLIEPMGFRIRDLADAKTRLAAKSDRRRA
jgi:hypothetical protein